MSKHGWWQATAVVLLGIIAALPAAWSNPTFPPLTGRVVDNAHVLSPEQTQSLTAALANLESQTTEQVVVATVPSLQGYDIADYGYQLGRIWGIGQKGRNNGLILLVAPAEHKVRIEVGYGLEGTMTDALASTIIQQAILPRFKANDMSGGIIAGVNALAGVLTGKDLAYWQQHSQVHGNVAASASGGSVVFFILLFFLFMFFGRFMGPLWIAGALLGGGRGFGGGGGFGSGGSDSGFSGGGGSFGGGGASGDW